MCPWLGRGGVRRSSERMTRRRSLRSIRDQQEGPCRCQPRVMEERRSRRWGTSEGEDATYPYSSVLFVSSPAIPILINVRT
jgi:hypothetical protein